MTEISAPKTSKTASARSARLVAVQTLYGVLHSGEEMSEALADILSKSDKLELHGEPMVPPDKKLLQKILRGVDERKKDLHGIIQEHLKKGKSEQGADTEVLLQSILYCGSYELLAHHEIDSPIIINDYLDVTHGFYEKGQVNLVNAILDSIARLVRS
ncbi:MAG: transcription antitermination factor NusB [Alphaproteobacteria bacterium]